MTNPIKRAIHATLKPILALIMWLAGKRGHASIFIKGPKGKKDDRVS